MLDFLWIFSDWAANEKPEISNPILTVPIKLPSSENPTPETNRAKVIPYFVLTQKYKTFPAIPNMIPTIAGILPFLFIVQTGNLTVKDRLLNDSIQDPRSQGVIQLFVKPK